MLTDYQGYWLRGKWSDAHTAKCWKTPAKRTTWSRYLGKILGLSQQIVTVMNLLRVSQMRAGRYWEAFDCWAKAQYGSLERWHRWGPICSSVCVFEQAWCVSGYMCDWAWVYTCESCVCVSVELKLLHTSGQFKYSGMNVRTFSPLQ